MNEKNDAYGRNDAQGVRNDSMNTDGRDIRDHRQDNGGMHGGNSGGSAYHRNGLLRHIHRTRDDEGIHRSARLQRQRYVHAHRR